ncbi:MULTISPECIES: acyltransferase family protein [unclassified Methylobacterium]|uniref:acyltransferase family protein n=1 Tax=unclassified Methylobacterium TaxID=2615210 RepID=UPI0009EAA9C8|nr:MULTISPECIES: acyltransferase family protein [unclassified Methylobacterium]
MSQLPPQAHSLTLAAGPPSAPLHMAYRPDIDGLRAVAVLVVLFFHAGVPGLSGGFVGVDVFFVISGYVITRGILADVAAGRFSLVRFYERRIRRILPMLVATILATYALALLYLPPGAMDDYARSVVAAAAFAANVFFWKTTGYFDLEAQTRPLLHTWSLSVEEQFYLVVPIALPLLLARSRRVAAAALLAALLASLALGIVLTNSAPGANFYLLPTRAWELLVGALLAFAADWTPPRALREAMATGGLGLVATAVLAYDEATPFPGLNALAPCLGAALLIAAGNGPTAIGRVLSAPPCAGLGRMSYALYMVHWPVVVFARYALLREPAGWEICAVVAACLVFAYAAWRWIETPFRYGRSTGTRDGHRPLFAATAAALTVLAALGLAGTLAEGFPARFPDIRPGALAALERAGWKGGRCFLENQRVADWAGAECLLARDAPATALLWGDSYAAHYVPGLVRNAPTLSHAILQYTFAGCPPLLAYASRAKPGCRDFNAHVFEIIRAYGIDSVVLAARWDLLPARTLANLPDTIARLTAAGVAVSVIGPSPLFAFDVGVLGARGAGTRVDGSAAWFAHRGDPAIRRLSAKARFADPLPTFCDGPLCRYRADGTDLFLDTGHLSQAGSERAVRAYFPLLR